MKRIGGWSLRLGLLALAFAACSAGDENPAVYKYYAFVTNNYSGSVSVFSIDSATGALSAVVGSPYKADYGGSVGIAVDPSGKFAYVAGSGGVSAFTIDSATGALAAVAGSPFHAGDSPRSIAVDPSGKFVYVAGYNAYYPVFGVSAFTIDAGTGALTAVPGSPFATGDEAFAVAVGPSGKFIYVVNYHTISVFAIDAAVGALTAITGSPFAMLGGPGIAIDPSGRYAYFTTYAFAIDAATGALTSVPGSPFAAGDEPSAVAVDPSGKFVYVTNHYSNNVSAFAINAATGALTGVTGSPFTAGERPLGLAVIRIAQ